MFNFKFYRLFKKFMILLLAESKVTLNFLFLEIIFNVELPIEPVDPSNTTSLIIKLI